MSDFIKLTTEKGKHVAVNVSQIQTIFGYTESTQIWIDGSDGPLLVTEPYEDILATIGAVNVCSVQSAPDKTDSFMYTDKENIQMLCKEIQELRSELQAYELSHGLQWVKPSEMLPIANEHVLFRLEYCGSVKFGYLDIYDPSDGLVFIELGSNMKYRLSDVECWRDIDK